ncbi:MAG: iron complex transport system substrate-binding protein [Gammaproteobacteria bacterium]|jgi:iron complex transport system substrate-binding protein
MSIRELSAQRRISVPTFVRIGGLFLIVLMMQASFAELSAIDDRGTRIALSAPAKRIVSLAPHLTELLFAAGAGGQIVGVVEHSDYPPEAARIRQVGASKSVSHEALIALKPDLVVAWYSGNGAHLITRLRQLGLTVYANEPQKLPDVARSLRDFGLLSGHAEIGNAAAEDFMGTYTQLLRTFADRKPVKVFYQVWNQPLITMNGKHLISAVIDLCGGRNVFADAIPIAPRINVESVLRLDPDAIVASGMADARPDWLDMWKLWPTLKAVRNQQLYFVPPDLLQRHTPRLLDGAKMLCEQLQGTRAQMLNRANADPRSAAD